MPNENVFQPSILSKVMAWVFALASLALCVLTGVGLLHIEDGPYLLILTTAIFPLLIGIVAVLRLAVILSRKIRVTAAHLDHRQLFKTHQVPWTSLKKVELLKRADDEIGTIRIQWQGKPFYLDHSSVRDWLGLIDAIMAHVPQNLREEVKEFTPLED